jgi:spoIIIJ-associated protein
MLKREAEIIKKETEELLDLIGVRAKVDSEIIKPKDEEKESVKIIISKTDESGLLIGAHGSTLAAIESFLNLSYRAKKGEWVRIIVDIGDWREKQRENLIGLGTQAAKRAKETGEPQYLYNLSPSQRREIHISLKDDKEIETESQGEGENRVLIIKAKSK